MDELNPIKSMLKDLITPIVKDAVTQALNVNESTATKHHIPIKEAIRIYGLSSSNIYRKFDEGTLTKVKNGGLTFVIQEEIEAQMTPDDLAKVRKRASKKSGK